MTQNTMKKVRCLKCGAERLVRENAKGFFCCKTEFPVDNSTITAYGQKQEISPILNKKEQNAQPVQNIASNTPLNANSRENSEATAGEQTSPASSELELEEAEIEEQTAKEYLFAEDDFKYKCSSCLALFNEHKGECPKCGVLF